MLERDFQKKLIKSLEKKGYMVMKLDSGYLQGVPDLLVLNEGRWATLEVKKSNRAAHQPNQDFYVKKMNGMSFSRFISPENKQEVISDMDIYLKGENAP